MVEGLSAYAQQECLVGIFCHFNYLFYLNKLNFKSLILIFYIFKLNLLFIYLLFV